MEPTDLTIQILREIRDEIRGTNTRVDETNQRLDQTNRRLDQTNQRLDQTNERVDSVREELGRRITESEIRTATAMSELAGTVREVRDLLADKFDLRDRVERCEREIDALKNRVAM